VKKRNSRKENIVGGMVVRKKFFQEVHKFVKSRGTSQREEKIEEGGKQGGERV